MRERRVVSEENSGEKKPLKRGRRLGGLAEKMGRTEDDAVSENGPSFGV